jgi:4'-phosphopantetheinyl transferase
MPTTQTPPTVERQALQRPDAALSGPEGAALQHEVHVWSATLGVLPRPDLERTLSAEERRHAQRFRRRDDRERFVLARCMARNVLGGYLNVDPRELRFLAGPHGKPALAGVEWLRFNASHSGEICVFAVAAHTDIGVDVEMIRDLDVSLLASRLLPQEARALDAGCDGRRRFFALWTRQEARAKAHGTGLPAFGHRVRRDALRCPVIDLPMKTGYVAAVACTGPRSRIVLRSWPGCDSARNDGDSLERAVGDGLPELLSAGLPAGGA